MVVFKKNTKMEIFARGVGRRKEAVAQVQIVKGTGQFIINQIPAQQYLHHNTCSLLSVKGPLNALSSLYLPHLPESNSSTFVSPGVEEHSSNNGTSSGSSQKQVISFTPADPLLPKSLQLRELSSESPVEEQPSLDRFLGVGESQGVAALREDIFSKMDTIVKVKGGGLVGQAEAIRLGLARACCLLTTETTNLSLDEIRKQLKDKGYLTQDSRVKERRKYGLKKARKATQYNKR